MGVERMAQRVVQYNLEGKTLEVFKGGSIKVDGEIYPSIREYESRHRVFLDSVYPFWLVVNIKTLLGWNLLHLNGVYYEQDGSKFYRITDYPIPCGRPKGAKKVSWDKHPLNL